MSFTSASKRIRLEQQPPNKRLNERLEFLGRKGTEFQRSPFYKQNSSCLRINIRRGLHIFPSVEHASYSQQRIILIHEFPRGKRTAPLFPLAGIQCTQETEGALIGRHGRLIGNFSHAREPSHADFCFVSHPPFYVCFGQKRISLSLSFSA